MRVYKLSMNGDFGHADSMTIWVGRKRDIPAAKRQLWDACCDSPIAVPGPHVEELNVPHTRASLLEFLNLHCDR